jgi:hypothetical protein
VYGDHECVWLTRISAMAAGRTLWLARRLATALKPLRFDGTNRSAAWHPVGRLADRVGGLEAMARDLALASSGMRTSFPATTHIEDVVEKRSV